MEYVTIEELRKQCNIDFDIVDDDSYLIELLAAAQCWAEDYLNRPLTDLVNDGKLKQSTKHALKILVADFYANREDTAFAQPHRLGTIQMLLQPDKKYT